MSDLTLASQLHTAAGQLQQGRLEDAARVCVRVLANFPKHVKTLELLAEIRMRQGRAREAADLLYRVLSADPESRNAYALLGYLNRERGDLERALWYTERAFELAPGDERLRHDLKDLYAQIGRGAGARLKLTRGGLVRIWMRNRFYWKVAKEIETLLAEQPERMDLRLLRAEALWRNGQEAESERVCQQVLEELPNCLKALLILGEQWLNGERDAQAREMLQRAMALDPENALAQELFGPDSPLPPRVPRLPVGESEWQETEGTSGETPIDGQVIDARFSLGGKTD